MTTQKTHRAFYLTLAIAVVAVISLLSLPYIVKLDGAEGNDWFTFLGRFHIVILHLPIGWIMLVPILEYFARKYPDKGLRKIIHITLACACIIALATVTLGTTLASSGGFSGGMVSDHMWMGIMTTVAAIFAYIFHYAREIFKKKIFTGAYVTSLFASLVAVSITGHLGGNLVQGEDYLYAKLPHDLQVKLGFIPPRMEIDFNTPIYASFIEPVLQQNCVSCHNEDKTKGQYRMDNLALLMQGGKSKRTAIVPNDIEKSELFHRITMPRDEKKAMPPDGRTPLGSDELALFEWWINIGAPQQESVNDLNAEQLPENIEKIIETIIANHQSFDQDIPSYADIDFEALNTAITELQETYGITISPVSQKAQDGLQMYAFNLKKPLDETAWNAISLFAPYVSTLDLQRAEISQKTIDAIGSLQSLESLNLSNTNLADISLESLAALQNLKMLNLFSSQVSDTNITGISSLRGLKKLYIGNTNVTIEGLTDLTSKVKRATVYHDIEIPEPSVEAAE